MKAVRKLERAVEKEIYQDELGCIGASEYPGIMGYTHLDSDPIYSASTNDTKYLLFNIDVLSSAKTKTHHTVQSLIFYLRHLSVDRLLISMPAMLAPKYYKPECCAVFIAKCVENKIPVDISYLCTYLPDNSDIRQWITAFLEIYSQNEDFYPTRHYRYLLKSDKDVIANLWTLHSNISMLNLIPREVLAIVSNHLIIRNF